MVEEVGLTLGCAPLRKGLIMLWLILGVVLLIIAIAGGVIIHPILFALAILAFLLFFMRSRGGATY